MEEKNEVTMEETSKMNLFQKMAKITEELNTVAKNLEVKGGDGRVRYNAVGETDVLDAVKPLEAKYGIYSYPLSRTCAELPLQNKIALRVETIYRFVNADNPSEYLDITSYGDGIDSGDKAPGKAMTYSDKYALMKAYKISTGDDPDKDLSPETLISAKQANYLKDLLKPYPDVHVLMLGTYNISKVEKLPISLFDEVLARVKKNIEKRKENIQPVKTPVKEVTEAPKIEKAESVVETPKVKTPIKEEPAKTEPTKIEPTESVKEETKASETELIDSLQKAKILAIMPEERRAKMLKAYKHESIEELTKEEANKVLEKLSKEKK